MLYKRGAARVLESGAKRITIERINGERLRVRPKDVLPLHPGPITNLSDLNAQSQIDDNLLAAWELLAGSKSTLAELVDLAYGESTPDAAWIVWQNVAEGLYFDGDPDQITVHTAEEVHNEKVKREARELEQRRWDEFAQRIAAGKIIADDSRYLQDVEALALGEQPRSRILHSLGKEETPQNAHDLLLKVGYWDSFVNPYPARARVQVGSAQGVVPPLADESRHDLTHLLSLAIDDEGSEDPDDALSWEDGRLWVHVADVAALVKPGDALDLEARDRGANLYLPEGTATMLPVEVTQQLGLGLNARSPALSFGIDLTSDGRIENIDIVPSWINVTRWSYQEAETRLEEPLPARLLEIADTYKQRRREAGAVEIDLPEVRVKVQDGDITISPLLPLRSRDLVREAMLIAGEAIAEFAQENEIPIPYTIQEPPTDDLPEGDSMSTMFGRRKFLKPSRQSLEAGVHGGLGMEQYAQVTSPLRRYLDLVIHQQLRSFLQDRALMTQQEILQRIGSTSSIQRDLRRTERLSRRHWTHAYLMQHPQWQGEGVIVEHHGRRQLAILPDLDLETDLYLPGEQALDSRLLLERQEVNLANLETRFRVEQQQDPDQTR